jgi:hypothetical protein
MLPKTGILGVILHVKKTDGQQKMYTNGDVSDVFSSMLSTRVGL